MRISPQRCCRIKNDVECPCEVPNGIIGYVLSQLDKPIIVICGPAPDLSLYHKSRVPLNNQNIDATTPDRHLSEAIVYKKRL